LATSQKIVLFHSPQTRSTSTLGLLEELGAPYELRVIDMKAGEQRQPAFLAVNPLGKVPAVLHGDALITEQSALVIYLADLFPEAVLTPGIADPLRGPYLRWIVFYAACFEPAIVDRALKRDPGTRAMSPYGDFDSTVGAVVAQLSRGPFICGERFTAADVLWGTALSWTTGFGLVEPVPVIARYVERWKQRSSAAKVAAIDAKLVASAG